jgi:hypothetical protein
MNTIASSDPLHVLRCGQPVAQAGCMQEHGCSVDYWSFPAPTLWSETKHIGGSEYTSKMAEFEAFVDRAKLKALPFQHVSASDPAGPPSSQFFSMLQLGNAKGSGQSSQNSEKAASSTTDVKQPAQSLLVVSDFPHLHNTDARDRFKQSLAALVSTAQGPTVILVTDSGVLRPCVAPPRCTCCNHRCQLSCVYNTTTSFLFALEHPAGPDAFFLWAVI